MGGIVLRNVCKDYARPDGTHLQVLRDVSFAVGAGTFNSIVGPSGCGKSTILNLIAGLDTPGSGQVSAEGKRIGFVFQQPRLLNWRTVTENVALPLEGGSLKKAEQRGRACRHLALVGLAGYENYYPLQLSGGMQQRVAIARALVIEPEILLMDEPFSGLDEWTARKLRQELVRIWVETGKTLVFVTHSISEAVFLSQQILIVTPKPATIFKQVGIDLPYPRNYDDLRLFGLASDLTRAFLSMI